MIRFIQTVSFLGFFICLFIMYTTNHGIPGIRKYDSSFQLPDMRFRYNVEQITQDFQQIGKEGRRVYQRYLYLDFVFIVCFLVLMLTISHFLFAETVIYHFLITVCMLRALFDVLENSIFLLVVHNYPAINKIMINLCSNFTSFKFIMLYIWMFSVAIQLIFLGFSKIQN